MLSPFRFFRIYQSTLLHFTGTYNIFKYFGTAKTINREIFDNHKDTIRFAQWSSKINGEDEAMKLCVFNFITGNNTWFYGTFENAMSILKEKNKFYSQFTENIKNDNNTIAKLGIDKGISLEQIMVESRRGKQSPLLQLFFQGRVSLEFLCVLNTMHNFIDGWKNSIDPLAVEIATRVEKYTPFMLRYTNG